MKLEHSFKRAGITIVGLVALLSMAAAAQEIRSEITVQGSGFFTKNSQGNGVQNHAEDTGGFLVGYRYNINRWLAAEANYGYDRNTQTYFGSTLASVQSNVHQITGSAVVKMPGIRGIPRLQPYALAGGCALVFDPTGKAGTFAGATRQTGGAFLYGGGADYVFTSHWSLLLNHQPASCFASSLGTAALKGNLYRD